MWNTSYKQEFSSRNAKSEEKPHHYCNLLNLSRFFFLWLFFLCVCVCVFFCFFCIVCFWQFFPLLSSPFHFLPFFPILSFIIYSFMLFCFVVQIFLRGNTLKLWVLVITIYLACRFYNHATWWCCFAYTNANQICIWMF